MPLHTVDLPVGAPPLDLRAEPFHALDQHAAIPCPVKDGDVPGLGHLRPEAPQVMMSLFDVIRGGDRHNLVPPRIEVLRQTADVASFAGGVPPLVSNDDGYASKVELVLQFAYDCLGFLQPGSVLLRCQ